MCNGQRHGLLCSAGYSIPLGLGGARIGVHTAAILFMYTVSVHMHAPQIQLVGVQWVIQLVMLVQTCGCRNKLEVQPQARNNYWTPAQHAATGSCTLKLVTSIKQHQLTVVHLSSY